MTTHDPGEVEAMLFTVNPVDIDSRTEGAVYAAACYFGWRCGSNRAARLTRLLSAPHPIVRTAAAIYLSFADSAMGLAALRDHARSSDFAGQWASVALASRGEKQFVERALAVFQVPAGATIFDNHRTNLQVRLAVLLSNSAADSGVEAPPGWRQSGDADYLDVKDGLRWLEYMSWWSRVRDRIRVHDPWLAESLKQQVD